mmetsp:Transcript_74299/g.147152  ORF Transcript_74299/g.147152 Transcript_74299/m.147152 type:complete len:221 (+) Transcript_74299:434-1096(+)
MAPALLTKAEPLARVFSKRQKASSMDMMPPKEGVAPLNILFASIEEVHAACSIPPLAELAPITEYTVRQTRHTKKMIRETNNTAFRQPGQLLCLILRRKTRVQHQVHFLWQHRGHCGQHCGGHALQQQQSHVRRRQTNINKGVQTSIRNHGSVNLSNTFSDDSASASKSIILRSLRGARLMNHCASSLSCCFAAKISTPSQYAEAALLASSAAPESPLFR